MTASIDLGALRDRLCAALPQLTYEMVELEHSDTGERHPALSIETSDRKKDCVYKMAVTVIDDQVNFFVHVHGKSGDLTTRGAQRFSKTCPDADEVFAIVRSCWTGSSPS
jgi:hypothetical protein